MSPVTPSVPQISGPANVVPPKAPPAPAQTTPKIVEVISSPPIEPKAPISPSEAASSLELKKLVDSQNLIQERLKSASTTISPTDVKRLTSTNAAIEQQKEFTADETKLAQTRQRKFGILTEQIKLLEREKASGGAALGLDENKHHHERLGKLLGYDEQFIKNTYSDAKGLGRPKPIDLVANSTKLEAASGELAQMESEVQTKWRGRLSQAADIFKTKVPGSDWARQNPMKAMTVTLAISEAVTGAMRAEYSPDSKHSAIPSLIAALNQDVATLGEFTTEQGGLAASIAAEATRKGLDAATVLGGIYAVDRALARTVGSTKGGEAVASRLFGATGMKVLGAAGVAYTGYSAFADGRFGDMNDTQIAGNIAGPLIAGATTGGLMGSPFGGVGAFPGAIAGIGIAAVSEVVGVAAGYLGQEQSINQDYEKKSVRESIRLAELGFVYPDGSPEAKVAKGTTDAQKEVLEHYSRAAVLSLLLDKDDSKQLSTLGFKSSKLATDDKQKKAIADHNWNRMTELVEGRSWYNPTWIGYGNYIDDVRGISPKVAQDFETMTRDARAHFTKLYNRSIGVTFKNGAILSAIFELDDYTEKVGRNIRGDASPMEVLASVAESFPGLSKILEDRDARNKLINNLENNSGNTGKFRRVLDLEDAVRYMVHK